MIQLLAGLALLYAGVCVLGAASYRRLLYPAPVEADRPIPSDATRIDATAKDGTPVFAMRFAARGGGATATTVVHFHGNGETVFDDVEIARELALRGVNVVLAEYRGYGLSRDAGSPTEQGLYADAQALLDALAIPRDRLVLWGTSLGTGVAAEMALRGFGRELVLMAPYTSIPDVGAKVAPFLPVHWLVGDRFDTRSKAPRIRLPVLIIQGTQDEVVPFAMGQALSKTFPRAELITIQGGHHTDLFALDGPALLDAIAGVSR